MQYIPDLPYPDNERAKLELLEDLFRDWHQHFEKNGARLLKHKADDMVFDGFYPHYFSRKKKRILFVAREPRRLSGANYLAEVYNAYREGKRIGEQHINSNKFHSRMMYVAYGIINDMLEWKDIKYADELGDTFGVSGGLSFAFMNISKLSNEGENWQLDELTYQAARELSIHGPNDRNFIQEEIAILEPEIIIAMNVEIEVLGKPELISRTDDVNTYWVTSGRHRALFLNTWHFSSPRKSGPKHFYNPICAALRHVEGDIQIRGQARVFQR